MVGTYGSLDQLLIQLAHEHSHGRETIMQTWTKEQGEP